MTTDLKSSMNVALGWTWRDRVGEFQITDSNQLKFGKELSDGGDPGQADVVWHAQNQSLAAGESMSLYLGALAQSLFGDTITVNFGRVKAILLVNKNVSGDGYLVVGGAGVQEWCAPFGMIGDTLKVMPDSPLFLASARDGWSVEEDRQVLKISAAGGPVVFDVVILGTSQGGSPAYGESSDWRSSSGI